MYGFAGDEIHIVAELPLCVGPSFCVFSLAFHGSSEIEV